MEVSIDNVCYLKRKLKDYGYYLKKVAECERNLLDIRDSIKDCRYASSINYSVVVNRNSQPRSNSRIHDLLMEEGEMVGRIYKYKEKKDSLKLDPLFEFLTDEQFELIRLHYFEGYSQNYIAVNKQYKYIEALQRKINKAVGIMLKNYED